jgi:hypothetical protein
MAKRTSNELPTSTLILASAQCSDCEDWDEAKQQVLLNGPEPELLWALVSAGERMRQSIHSSLRVR